MYLFPLLPIVFEGYVPLVRKGVHRRPTASIHLGAKLDRAPEDRPTGQTDGLEIMMPHQVAVLLPCHNEEATIGAVVQAFRTELPDAEVYVFDNNSSDATSKRAAEAGAIVRTERLQGKGNVMRRMFADIDADVYVVADGDGTYDAAAAPMLVEMLIADRLDMVGQSAELGVYPDRSNRTAFIPTPRAPMTSERT